MSTKLTLKDLGSHSHHYLYFPRRNLLALSYKMTTFTQPVRTRSHGGNIPKLPQTKFCTFCPAKFTRTTHLNRHVRSHINQRHYRCDMCGSEFTRSDLLSRHKKTCGNSQHTHRSRQKSCQACAESKIKCDLVYPCSKCISRGKVCVFVNDPEVSRMKKSASRSNRDAPRFKAEDTECLRASPASTHSTASGSFAGGDSSTLDSPSSFDGVFEQIEPPWHFGCESEGTDHDAVFSSQRHPFYRQGYHPDSNIRYSSSQQCAPSDYMDGDGNCMTMKEGVPFKSEYYDTYHLPSFDSSFEPSISAPHHMQQTRLTYGASSGTPNRHLYGGLATSAEPCNSIPQTAEQPSSNKAWFYDNHVSCATTLFLSSPAGSIRPFLG
ncbi:hypothetical protein L218DRAFT_292376 [Marasmius fiardii PR-910]|nr:hypothetical protein L218DRAFT_292376 [Marasmius fiardii PR-910]